jgi:prephenate dehydratase
MVPALEGRPAAFAAEHRWTAGAGGSNSPRSEPLPGRRICRPRIISSSVAAQFAAPREPRPRAASLRPGADASGRWRVAFAGERGSFAEDAVEAYFGGRAEPVPVPTFRDVFRAVTTGPPADEPAGTTELDAGVLPIENLVAGTVREVYDLLLEHDLVIVGEVIIPIRLCLAALRGERLERIERVYSHAQALGQAERFLRSRKWDLLTTYNTAGSGRLIAERKERGAAAVLSPRAAALFRLKVLAEDIQDVPGNRTRFLIVSRPDTADLVAGRSFGGTVAEGPSERGRLPPRSDRQMRVTLVMAVRNEPGSLHRALGVIAAAGLNMSKIESRPSREAAWEYVFWVDLDADLRAAATRMALAELAGVTTMVRVLGCYPRAEEQRPEEARPEPSGERKPR